MRELRRHRHAAVATRRHRTLPVQRLRSLHQDERHEPAAEAPAAAGTSAARGAGAGARSRRTQPRPHDLRSTDPPPPPPRDPRPPRAREESAPERPPRALRSVTVTMTLDCWLQWPQRGPRRARISTRASSLMASRCTPCPRPRPSVRPRSPSPLPLTTNRRKGYVRPSRTPDP